MNCDTPRTEEELLAIFADGQGPNTISPQDLRDFVVSIPGLSGSGPISDQGDLVAGQVGVNISVPGDGSYKFLSFTTPDVIRDPSGVLQDDTYDSPDWYGMTIPAKAWGLLGSGLWRVGVLVQWASNPGDDAEVFADLVDNRLGDGSLAGTRMVEDYYFPDQYAIDGDALPKTGGLAFTQITTFHLHLVGDGAPWAVGWVAVQNTGSPIVVHTLQVRAWKLGEVA